ncbi:MAG: T9SS type A sorting domain-containing protein [Candidatus Marinimicrobia bacterium]|nr:T9SS type A sorting domain-containing protein [Candidatus Neomarinimicrobiota bacterium]
MHDDYPETLYSLAWHNAGYSPGGSDLPIPEYSSRASYYGVGGIPHTQWQGVEETVGGYPNGNWTPMYNSFVPIYNTYIVDALGYDVLLYGGVVNTTVNYTAEITRNDNSSGGSINVTVFAWEDHIEGYWSGASLNGETRFAVRDQLAAETFTINSVGESETITGSFELLDNWAQENVGITAIVQQSSDKLVVGVTQSGLDGLVIDSDEDGVLNHLDNCPDDYNPNQEDVDGDLMGDVCDACDNANVYVVGNVTGDVLDNAPVIDLFDVLMLVDLILNDEYPGCTSESANYNGDNYVNVLDVVQLAQYVMGFSGRVTPMAENAQASLLTLHDNFSTEIIVSSQAAIGGVQFEVTANSAIESSLDNIALPDGWVLNYREIDGMLNVMLVDLSAENAQQSISFDLRDFAEFESVIVSSRDGKNIPVVFDEKETTELIGIPATAKLNDLYPNPFNPVVSVPFSLPYQMDVRISVYNLNGQLVEVLMDEREMVGGSHKLSWNATQHASGVYLIQIQTAQGIDTQKAFLLK